MTKIINLLSGPGAGKSTLAAHLYYRMKVLNYSVELVSEFAKDCVYEGHANILKDQLYVFAKQNRRVERLRNQVDFVITDSAAILSLFYTPPNYHKTFLPLVLEVHNSYNNINYLIERSHPFNQEGRIHNYEESLIIDNRIRRLFTDNFMQFITIKNDSDAIDTILEHIKDMEKNK